MNKIIAYHVFPFDVMVVKNTKYSKISKLLKAKLPEDVHQEIKLFKGKYDARTVMFSSGATCIVFNTFDSTVIAHESFHAVSFLLHRLGIKHNKHTEELYAYLVGYLVNEINKIE